MGIMKTGFDEDAILCYKIFNAGDVPGTIIHSNEVYMGTEKRAGATVGRVLQRELSDHEKVLNHEATDRFGAAVATNMANNAEHAQAMDAFRALVSRSCSKAVYEQTADFFFARIEEEVRKKLPKPAK